METSSDSCDIIYLFIHPSDSQGVDMIFIMWLLLHILSLGAVMTRIQAR